MRDAQWEQEGALENLLGSGIDLLYYIDHTHGVFHYILLVDGDKEDERRLLLAEPDDRKILDGVKVEWQLAWKAKEFEDVLGQFAFTWRGLRLLFPKLPEEPLLTQEPAAEP